MGKLDRLFFQAIHRKSNINGLSSEDYLVVSAAVDAVGDDQYSLNMESAYREKRVVALEEALKHRPNEFAYLYTLSDLYMRNREYAKGLNAAQLAFNVRSNEPRAIYALATVYRTMGRARYLAPQLFPRFRSLQARGRLSEEMNPIASLLGLRECGLSVEEALSRSLSLFQQLRQHDLTSKERAEIEENIRSVQGDLNDAHAGVTVDVDQAVASLRRQD